MAIYFIRQGGFGRIKIGYTSKAGADRLGQLQTGASERLELLAEFPGTKETEASIHLLLREHRAGDGGKEWFVADAAMTMLEVLRAVSTPSQKPPVEQPIIEAGPFERTWSRFFDEMGVGWCLGRSGFWLPGLSLWLVSAEATDGHELAKRTGANVISFSGRFGAWLDSGDYKSTVCFSSGGDDAPYIPCLCPNPNCNKLGFEYDGRGARVCGEKCRSAWLGVLGEFGSHEDKGYSFDHPKLVRAIRATLGHASVAARPTSLTD